MDREPRGSGTTRGSLREYSWFAAVLIVLLIAAATAAGPPDVAANSPAAIGDRSTGE